MRSMRHKLWVISVERHYINGSLIVTALHEDDHVDTVRRVMYGYTEREAIKHIKELLK